VNVRISIEKAANFLIADLPRTDNEAAPAPEAQEHGK
jgi:hypothetical protein